MLKITFSTRERDTVLCALRLLQQVDTECDGELTAELEDIRCDHAQALDTDEIDSLCERLNL
jgi:hypothetical protein